MAPLEHARGPSVSAASLAAANIRHGVPAAVSFFLPGVGQLIKGDVLGFGVIVLGMILSACLMVFGVGIFTGFALWVWGVYDAYTAPDGPTKRELKRLSQR